MTNYEAQLLAKFIDDLGRRMGNAGCNDFTLPDTEENRTLVRSAEQYGMGKDAKEKLDVQGGKIVTDDFVVLDYLKHRMLEDYQ